jgi:hypothetical protein
MMLQQQNSFRCIDDTQPTARTLSSSRSHDTLTRRYIAMLSASKLRSFDVYAPVVQQAKPVGLAELLWPIIICERTKDLVVGDRWRCASMTKDVID